MSKSNFRVPMESLIPVENDDPLLFEALLYVLRDPTIKISEFEARLEDDPALGEKVIIAVELVSSLQQIALRTKTVGNRVRTRSFQNSSNSSDPTEMNSNLPTSEAFRYFYLFGAVAACALVWAMLRTDTEVDPDGVQNNLSLIQSWYELQNEGRQLATQGEEWANLDAPESLAADLLDKGENIDVPQWIFLAVAAGNQDETSKPN